MDNDDTHTSCGDAADALLAGGPDVGLEPGVEREQMLASLHASLFGTEQTVRLGRFELGARRGAGAMGVVYEARDPQLDRKVALKVLRAPGLDGSAVERLVVEARALAKLRHPNVVTVYEVGQDGGDRFIVMDLVQGETLRSWLRTPRPWRAIVRMFIGAGEGLRAAHEAGLVHRDFKPDNVLVEDGQPKVVDFGLAAMADDPIETTLPEPAAEPVVLSRLTQTAGFVGTPVYMAPEQYRGQATPAADQYAFCVALFEALEGRRPHADAETGSVEAFLAARTNLPPAGLPQRAPRWLRRALARGLAPAPADRWPSMAALLGALRRVSGSRRRKTAATLGVLGVAGLAGAMGSQWSEDPLDPCAEAEGPIRDAWSTARQAELQRAFAKTELAYAADTWRRVTPVLDLYAAQWGRAAKRACAADLAASEPLPPLNVARGVCLDRRRSDFESLLETFATPDPDIVDRAIDAATTIPPMDHCDEAVLLRAQLERARGRNVASPKLYVQVSAADAAFRTGNTADALRRAEQVLAQAREVGDHELVALSAKVIAQVHKRTGALPDALEAASDAVEAAERLGDSRLRLRAQMELLSVLTEQRAFEPGERLARFARASLTNLGDPPALLSDLSLLQGWLLLYKGELEPALEHFERTEALLRQRESLAPARHGRTLSGKGAALEQLGRHDEAVANHRHAVELLAERLGADTPRVINARMDLATSLSNLGRSTEGIAEATRAVDDADALLGASSLIAAQARATLAIAYATSGKLQESEPLFRAAAVAVEKNLGSENPESAAGWMNLARVLPHLDKSAEAVEVLERAAEILSHTLPEDHPDFIFIYTNLAEAHLQLEAWDAALQAARSAEAIAGEHVSDDNARMAPIRVLLGTALRGKGDLQASQQVLGAVLSELQQSEARAGLVALAQYELALTVSEAGDPSEATVLMRAARAAFEADGEHKGRVRDIDGWLDEHS